MTLEPGAVLGRYRIDAELGRGGMGEVYRAHDTVLGRSVALKILRQEKLASRDDTERAELEARFLREARAAAATKHANVVALYDFGAEDGVLFIAMELVVGEPLRASIGDANIPLFTRARWLSELASALASIHEAGLVHRDVKPDNVMLTREGSVKLLDFGIARRVTHADSEAETVDPVPPTSFRTVTGHIRGTPRYMAPEQRMGGPIDARADQYAWGLVAFELFSGVAAPGPALLSEALAACVPPVLANIVERALSARPEERFDSMAEVARAVAPFGHAEAFTASDTKKVEAALPKRSTRRVALVVGSVAVALAAAAVVVGLRASKRPVVTNPVSTPADGRFCWVDLATSDAPASIAFYTRLFDWTARPEVFGRGAAYTAMARGDSVVAAIAPVTTPGAPSEWASYVAVSSVEAAIERATPVGGERVAAPFDVAGLGRVARVRDPTGAVVGLLEAIRGGPARSTPFVCEPGAVCWNELWTDTSPRTAPFYGALVGWTTTPPAKGYVFFVPRDGNRAVAGTIPVPLFGAASAWGVYFSVVSCDDAVARARGLGAAVVIPPTDVPGVGRYAVLRDPRGAIFAVVRQQGE